MFDTGKKISRLEAQMKAFQTQNESLEQTVSEQAKSLRETVEVLQNAANKHDLVLEDLVDSWEEWQEAQREERAQQHRQETEEAARREKALLQLATAACDRLIELQAAAAEDETWSRQIHLMWEKLSEPLMLAGLQRLGQPGEPVSYLLHEPIDTVDTADATLHMRVAKVLSGGYAYQGKVLRKARVTVYRAESISQTEG